MYYHYREKNLVTVVTATVVVYTTPYILDAILRRKHLAKMTSNHHKRKNQEEAQGTQQRATP